MKVKVKAESKSTPSKTVIISRKKVHENSQNLANSANPVNSSDVIPELRLVRKTIPQETAEAEPEILPELKHDSEKSEKQAPESKNSIKIFLALGLLIVILVPIIRSSMKTVESPEVMQGETPSEVSENLTESPSTESEPETEPESTLPVLEIDPERPMIALTYDDGPAVDFSDRILDTLEKYQAHATFFLVGDNITEHTENILKREVDLGCEIGNHTLSHKNLEKLSLEDAVLQLSQCDDKIYQCTGTKAKLVRPPYGAYNDAIREADKRMFIYWSLNTNDWKREDPDEICDIVMEYIDDGDIILMHDIHEQSAKASEKLIPALIEQGYQLVTVSELIHYRNLQTEDGMLLFNVHPDGAFFNSLYGTICDYELQKEKQEIVSYDEE